MALPVSTLNNTTLYLRYPTLPAASEQATRDVRDYADQMQAWYDDLVRLLQRDREEIIASIKKITP